MQKEPTVPGIRLYCSQLVHVEELLPDDHVAVMRSMSPTQRDPARSGPTKQA